MGKRAGTCGASSGKFVQDLRAEKTLRIGMREAEPMAQKRYWATEWSEEERWTCLPENNLRTYIMCAF